MSTGYQAGVYYDHPGWFRLSCRYDPWLQGDLKEQFGLGNYKYDPKLKMWYIREPYKKAMVDLLGKHGYDVEFEEQQKDNSNGDQKQRSKTNNDQQKEQKEKKQQVSGPRNYHNPWSSIFARIPDGVLRHKLYRSVTLILHPDKGGSEEAMKELNEAWSKLNP
tara:strand:+ start:12458 stop:12946 length:489 start_codon:yes stop_codon:yes gene_type:complete